MAREGQHDMMMMMISGILIGLVGRVFASCPGDQGSIPGRVIPKTQKMVLDAALLTLSIIR